MFKKISKVNNPKKQANWIIENKDNITTTSCPPFEYDSNGKYNAGCKYCIVHSYPFNNGCTK